MNDEAVPQSGRDGARPALRVAVAAALALAWAFAGPRIPGALAAPVPEEPKPGDLVAQATKLRDEAKEYFKVSGDPDAEQSERSKARKECFKKLKEARKLLDEHLAAHPEQAEALDALYCDVSATMFWLKKELTLEEIKELQGGAPVAPGGGPSAGPRPAAPPAPPPAGSGGNAAPPSGEPPKPAGPTAADGIAEVEKYVQEHPGDVPGQYEQYEAFLEKFPDASTPEYAKAAAALKGLDERLKGVYRLARDEDPDAVRTEDPAETQRRLQQLLTDLASSDAAVRTRAAKLLGYLGSAEAVPPLLEALRNAPEGAERDSVAQALADLGGRRTFEKLLKATQKDSTVNVHVVDVLRRSLRKGGPQGRLAGETLARFAERLPLPLQEETLTALQETLPAGGVGLAHATAVFAPDERRAELIEKVGELKDPRTVAHLSRFLFVSPTGRRAEQAAAARDAIESIGKPGVRYLIPALDEPANQLWAAELLKKITGTKQKDDKRKTWETWFRKNRKSME